MTATHSGMGMMKNRSTRRFGCRTARAPPTAKTAGITPWRVQGPEEVGGAAGQPSQEVRGQELPFPHQHGEVGAEEVERHHVAQYVVEVVVHEEVGEQGPGLAGEGVGVQAEVDGIRPVEDGIGPQPDVNEYQDVNQHEDQHAGRVGAPVISQSSLESKVLRRALAPEPVPPAGRARMPVYQPAQARENAGGRAPAPGAGDGKPGFRPPVGPPPVVGPPSSSSPRCGRRSRRTGSPG